MALGKERGSMTFKVTSTRYTPGPGNATTLALDVGGPMSGELAGIGQGTITAVAELGEKHGTWSFCGAGYLDDGATIPLRGEGTITEVGKHTYRMKGFGKNPDGSTVALEVDADFATQTLTGKSFEWN